MSKTIDERVVEMRFDNAQFERNVSTSMSTLEKLKQSLQLSGVSNGIEQVGQKFSAFETMAVGALLRIGSQAVDTAEKLVKSLSIDQITAGWSKYNSMTASVQTLVNSTGKSVEEINGYLDKLMWFSDETSYSFTDMTAALATMTSSGGDIDKLIPLIEGVANATSFAGKGAAEFSRVMQYGINQAYSLGVMTTKDWMSIEGATVNSKQLEESLIAAGVALGKIKEGEVTVSNFRDSLSSKWLDKEVMESGFATFSKVTEEIRAGIERGDWSNYAEGLEVIGDKFGEVALRAAASAQEAKTFGEAIDATKDAVSSGWLNTFKIIFGDYEEAKKLWTDLANELWEVFASGAEERNKLLQTWKDLGGREDLIEAFWNVFHAIADIVSVVKDAFHSVFPPATAKRLADFTSRLKDITSRFKIFETVSLTATKSITVLTETGRKLRDIFSGIFSVFGIIKDVAVALIKPFGSLFSGAGSGALDFASSLGKTLVKLRETIKQSGVLEKITERLSGVFKALNEFIGNTVELFRGVSYWEGGGGIAGIFESMFDGVNNVIRLFFNAISALTGKDLGGVRDKIITTLQKIRDKVVDACGPLSDIFEKVKTGISKAFESIKKVFGKFGKINTGGISTLSEKTDKAFKPITALLEGVKKIFGAVWELLKKLAPVFSAVFTALGNFLGRIGEGVANVIKNADFSKLLDMVKGGLEVGIGVQIFQFIKSLKDGVKDAGGILSSVKETFEGIKTCITGLSDCIKAYEKNINAKTLLTIAGAIGILALSMLVLSSIDGAKLESAVLTITILFGELIGSFALLNKMGDTKKLKKVGTTMVELSAAVLVLAIALKSIAGLNAKQLTIGLIGITALLAEVVIAAKVLGNEKHSGKMMKGATNAIAFALAIKVLASSLKSIGSMSWEELAKGIVGISVLMIEMVTAVKILGNDKDSKRMLKGATNAVIFGAAMTVLARVLRIIAKLSWEELAKGLVGLTVILTEMVIAVKIIGNDKDSKRMLKGATNMLIFTAAVTVLANCVKQLAKLSWENLAKGLVGVTVILVEMVAAAKLMNGSGNGAVAMIAAAGAMLILSASLKSLSSLSWEQIAKGLVAIAAAFAIIGIAGYVLESVVPAIMGLSIALAVAGAGALLFGAGLLMVSAALTAFAGSIEIVVQAIIQIIIGLVKAIPDILGELAKSLNASLSSIIDLIVTVLESVLMALYKLVPLAVDILLDLILSTLRAIADNIQPIIESLLDIVVGAINGLTSGIPKIITATIDLIKAIIDALCDALGSFDVEAIAKALAAVALLDTLMVGIAAMTVTATVAVAPLPLIAKHLNDFIVAVRSFLDEIQNVDPASLQGAKALAEMILILTATGILDGLTSWFTGGSSMAEFGQQLAEFAPYMRKYASIIKGVDSGVVESSANAALSLSKFANALPRSGGLAQLLIGEHDLGKFAEDLAAFGPSFKKYSDSVKGINAEAVKASSIAAQSITAFVETIPRSGGLAQLLLGEHDLSKFAKELVEFGPSFKKYSDSIKGVNASAVKASSTAAKSITEFVETIPRTGGLVQLFTGSNSLKDLAKELVAFGPSFKKYSESVKGINASAVKASSTAAKSITEFVKMVPRTGGLVQLITGENSLKTFAKELEEFGPAFKAYSDSIKGINATSVSASSAAAKSITEFVKTIPPSGGLVQLITGENSLKTFAEELEDFGPAFKAYSDSVTGIDANAVKISSIAAKSITEFVDTIPKSGGLVQLITGENSLKTFAEELEEFGPAFKAYSDSVTGVDAEAVESSSTAAKSIAEFAAIIPPSGGLVQLITGENSLKTFGLELGSFGPYFKKYADSVTGIDAEAVESSSTAAKSIAEFAAIIPPSGGLVQLITGENSLKTFGKELEAFGPHFKKYADSVTGIDGNVVRVASNAALIVAKMADTLPEHGGVKQWFTGEESISKFGEDLAKFGPNFKSFADSVEGITGDSITVASEAALKTAQMAASLPKEGGVAKWITGEASLTKFGNELATFGPQFREYIDSLEGVTIDSNLSESLEAITDLVSNLPEYGGVKQWFTGEAKLSDFGRELEVFGQSLHKYFSEVSNLSDIDKASELFDTLTTMLDRYDDVDSNLAWVTSDIVDGLSVLYSSCLSDFTDLITGTEAANKIRDAVKEYLTHFGNSFTTISAEYYPLFSKYGKDIVDQISSGMGDKQKAIIPSNAWNICSTFIQKLRDRYESIKQAGEYLVSGFCNGISSSTSIEKVEKSVRTMANAAISAAEVALDSHSPSRVFYEIGSYLVDGFCNGINANIFKAEAKAKAMAKATSTAAKNELDVKSPSRVFYEIGGYLVDGFCNGINANIFKAEARAKAMAKAASTAAKNELEVKSPSRVFYEIGDNVGKGFVNALDDKGKDSFRAGQSLARQSVEGTFQAIGILSDAISNGVDTEPTIRPVLDLSDVTHGAHRLSAMLSQSHALSISADLTNRSNAEGALVGSNGSPASISFTQNNYSPKALSRFDIYRNTQNLLNIQRRMVNH